MLAWLQKQLPFYNVNQRLSVPSGLDLPGRGDRFQLVIELTSWNCFLISVPDVLIRGARTLRALSVRLPHVFIGL